MKDRSVRVDLALFDGDELMTRSSFRVSVAELASYSPLFKVTHKLGQEAADVVLSEFPTHVDLKTIVLKMPIHESSDWESIDMGRYSLAFWCRLDA
ncbi:hypothetical protein VA603_10040 [Stenotrophomonas sp. MH1]|uniref:Uncharacterized protein n=1 Tax=Stenotrophomonas capsici TaxID=3110230 RepID=A0ABU5V3E9_9GAMM|nr:hypothetical protein [Stenotrophomonas sp. MH1]MEA5667871.1 hypothetical protein [Stenotrophomonas sp. MH1]